MKKLVVIALTTALSAPAFAGGKQAPLDEPEVVAPEPVMEAPAAYNWSGPYAGFTFGLGRVTSNTSTPDQTGLGAALHAGYNLDMGDWVIGTELDLAPGALVDLSAGDREIGNSGRLKLRGGPKLGADGRTFAFGTLGVAHVRSSDNAGSYSDTGWLAGVGLSHAVRENWFVTGELTHHRFRDVAGTNANVNATAATAGMSFRF